MRSMELMIPDADSLDYGQGRNTAYLMSFCIYGYFGIIYRWIKYRSSGMPEEVNMPIVDNFS